jgi:hypothetical protein
VSNVAGIDDAPFVHAHRGDVPVVAAICARTRLDGVLIDRVRRDGANATRRIAHMLAASAFGGHLRAVLIQGIAVAGFNVVDIQALSQALGLPVIAVVRRRPDREAIRRALLERVPGGRAKWQILERLGAPEPLGSVYVQRAGVDRERALGLLSATTLHGNLPEPLRLAHLIAGALATGHSRGGA